MHENLTQLRISRVLGIKILTLFLVCDLFLILFGMLFMPFQILTGLVTVSVLAKISVFYFYSREIKNPFNLLNLFLLFFLFFSLGIIPLLLFDINPEIPFKLNQDSKYMALLYSNLFLSGYVLSASFTITLKLSGSLLIHRESRAHQARLSYLAPIVLALACLFCLAFFMSVKDVIRTSLEQGYMSIYQAGASSVGFMVSFTAAFAIPTLLSFFLMNGPRFNKLAFVGFGLFFLVIISSYLTGVRSIAVFALLGLCFTYRRSISKKNLIRLSTSFFGFAVFFVLPLSAYIRGLQSSEKFSLKTVAEFFLHDHWSPFAVFKETSFTADIFAKVIELSANQTYLFGLSYLRSVYNILPQRVANVFFVEPPDFLANWFVRNVDQGWYDVGGGFAFNFIAEAYINFGFVGVLLLSLITGGAFSSISYSNSEYRSSIWRELLEALLIVNIMIWVRSETLAIIRPVLWYSIFPVISICLFESLDLLKPRKSFKVDNAKVAIEKY